MGAARADPEFGAAQGRRVAEVIAHRMKSARLQLLDRYGPPRGAPRRVLGVQSWATAAAGPRIGCAASVPAAKRRCGSTRSLAPAAGVLVMMIEVGWEPPERVAEKLARNVQDFPRSV